jgi:hypothetical protein
VVGCKLHISALEFFLEMAKATSTTIGGTSSRDSSILGKNLHPVSGSFAARKMSKSGLHQVLELEGMMDNEPVDQVVAPPAATESAAAAAASSASQVKIGCCSFIVTF